jgi:hypothetical protein
MHAAADADAALLADSRHPILYLRSFKDDPYRIDPEWDMVVRTPWSRGGRRREQGLIARLIASMPTGLNSMSGGRLEERLGALVAPIGPFITVGAPDEPLPQLGAARVYLASIHRSAGGAKAISVVGLEPGCGAVWAWAMARPRCRVVPLGLSYRGAGGVPGLGDDRVISAKQPVEQGVPRRFPWPVPR